MLLRAEVQHTEVVKKSKFAAFAIHAKTFECAMQYLEKVRDVRANHNCWAYKSSSAQRMSDDGEPGGTAGRPIYTAIEALHLTDTMVVVTRYFGGIKLGTGGLIRAYHSAAKNALLTGTLDAYVATTMLTVRMPSGMSGLVYNTLEQFKRSGVSDLLDPCSDGSHVTLQCCVAAADVAQLREILSGLCKGNITFTEG